MDCFIKKIFEDKVDDLAHLQFEKYGRGEYKEKAVIIAKRVKDTYKIGTTAEFGNELVRAMAEKLGDKKTKVTGIIVSTRDLTGELDFVNKKQFMGVKQYVMNSDMSGRNIVELCDKLPRAFFGLSFKTEDSELKIKPKAPKSAKPSTSTKEKLKADFCKLITTDKKLAGSLIFDLDNFKSAEIKHTLLIEDIVLPKGVEDPLKMREMAKRKGKLIREINVDGKEIRKEKEFLV